MAKTHERTLQMMANFIRLHNDGHTIKEIANRNTVVFCIGSDGTIEAPDKPEFPIDDSGYLELKNTLIERDECQDLRIRDITTLARLIKIVAKAERFTLICDSAELEAAFWALIENRQSGH